MSLVNNNNLFQFFKNRFVSFLFNESYENINNTATQVAGPMSINHPAHIKKALPVSLFTKIEQTIARIMLITINAISTTNKEIGVP
jgi:hypothetical protein